MRVGESTAATIDIQVDKDRPSSYCRRTLREGQKIPGTGCFRIVEVKIDEVIVARGDETFPLPVQGKNS